MRRTSGRAPAAVVVLLVLGFAAVLPGKEPRPRDPSSYTALNGLLRQIIAAHGQDRRGPKVPLDASLLQHINLTVGRGVHFGLLKNGGKLHWPSTFDLKLFQGDRAKTEELLGKALQALKVDPTKPLGEKGVAELTATVKRLVATLTEKAGDLAPSEYITARRYLHHLQVAVRALADPEAAKYVNGTYAPRGETVADLVEHMKRLGLQFAPAVHGEEDSYRALYAALAKYRAGLAPRR